MVYPNTATNTFTNGTTADADEVNANFTNLINGASALGVPAAIGMTPVGSIVAWHKSSLTVVVTNLPTTNTSQSATQLIDSGADFSAGGVVKAGMIVHNITRSKFAIVETVVNDTTITLANDVNADTTNVDLFNTAAGDTYAIYATPELPDNWLECNGQTISDADSPLNGMVVPNLHTAVEDVNGYFLRGVVEGAVTGSTEGSANLSHTHQLGGYSNQTGGTFGSVRTASNASNHGFTGALAAGESEARPVAFAIVWIIRIK
jgi:hypothetical protein